MCRNCFYYYLTSNGCAVTRVIEATSSTEIITGQQEEEIGGHEERQNGRGIQYLFVYKEQTITSTPLQHKIISY